MKRNVLIVGIMAIVMLSTTHLMAQRRQGKGDRDDGRDRGKDVRDNRKNDRNDRGGNYVSFNKKNKRDGRGNRNVRVKNIRVVNRDGYRGSSYYRYGNSRQNFRYQRQSNVYRPSKRHIWIGGSWEYSRRLGRDVWRDGYWVVKNRNHRYVDGHYARRGGVRIWIPGCWVVF